eukprot:713604-Alexandrium_andersonii.AAC.1
MCIRDSCMFRGCPSSIRGVVSATRPTSARLALAATPGRRRASWRRCDGPPASGAARFGSL